MRENHGQFDLCFNKHVTGRHQVDASTLALKSNLLVVEESDAIPNFPGDFY